MAEAAQERRRSYPSTYCVTGASGYIGSWLVKSLLDNGCFVHATVRDPQAKSFHLLSLRGADERLRLFKADLLEDGSFDEAVDGCDGVFHVAMPMLFSCSNSDDDYVRSNIVDPAIRGTLNLLRACLRAKSVKRVVLTSSVSTITGKDGEGKWRAVVDESCQIPIDYIWEKKASGWVYALSKILTEEAAFRFAKTNGIDLVSVITPTIAGPFLTKSVPSSLQVLLSLLTGDSEFFGILTAVNSRMGSYPLAHVEDICRAHIFLMEQASAEGRYLCCSQSCPLPNLLKYLTREYPSMNSIRLVEGNFALDPPEISSKKLKELGFSYKFGVEEIIRQTIESCIACGFLPPRNEVDNARGGNP